MKPLEGRFVNLDHMSYVICHLFSFSCLARYALLPQIEVDAGEGVAVDARVKEGIRDVKDGALHCAHVVRSLADNLGNRDEENKCGGTANGTTKSNQPNPVSA